MRHLFYCDTAGHMGSVGLLLLRLVMGAAFVFHGWPKIHNPMDWMGPEASVPAIFQALAALAEFGGGMALVVGLLTRLASLGIMTNMIVALGMVRLAARRPLSWASREADPMNWPPSTLPVPSYSFFWDQGGSRSMPFCSGNPSRQSRLVNEEGGLPSVPDSVRRLGDGFGNPSYIQLSPGRRSPVHCTGRSRRDQLCLRVASIGGAGIGDGVSWPASSPSSWRRNRATGSGIIARGLRA